MRVFLFNQADFPCPFPFLDLFLPRDGCLRAFMNLVVNQGLHSVFACKAFDNFLLVFPRALHEVGGHPDVQCSMSLARKYVNVELLFHGTRSH